MSSAQLDTVRADRLAKASTFEWCLSWTDLAPHLDPHRLGLRGEALPPLVGGRVLVPGAGTSELSAQLMSSGCYSEVISLDYDSGCTEHMAAHYRGEKGLEWVTADVCDPVAVAAAVAPGICGLVVDKSTLDYILADASQGPHGVAGCLLAMHQSVAPGGVIAIVSFHPPEFLAPLFVGGWLACERTEQIRIDTQPNMPKITLMLLRRPCDGPPAPPLESLGAHVATTIATWHTDIDPLLTSSERARIREEWPRDVTGAVEAVELAAAHHILFAEDLRREFPLQMFIESLDEGDVTQSDEGVATLSLENALKFVERSQ